ncbi:MAG: N-acetylmuramoyl-L-alanine amidase [Candidatus Omnitrophica bacterium]|nr:N-acetylmuramoyl-L-alanine amidase [Candidatus Omnitrophota bacterium]
MRKIIFLLNILCITSLVSCARIQTSEYPSVSSIEPYPIIPEKVVTTPRVLRTDVYHEVAPGETVWRISKMYDVKIEDIVKTNKLKSAAVLEKGQTLFIPDAAPLRLVIPLYPSRKWDYIIIHHSATDVGNALSFDYTHSNKRLWKGLGYHFVIDNGTSGKQDGQIEISPRWLHQDNGAHCKADTMNYRGIGICLVGNFNGDRVTQVQMESLVYLVNELKKYYHIPNSHILGHGQVKGANTDCPGKRFPWSTFRSRLDP